MKREEQMLIFYVILTGVSEASAVVILSAVEGRPVRALDQAHLFVGDGPR
jgi:hypothetical protein